MSHQISDALKQLKKSARVRDFATRFQTEFVPMLEREGSLLQHLDMAPIDEATVNRLASRLRLLLDDTIARSQTPLRVSLIGTFTSGKTATLCALLRKPRLLPTSKLPETGNVVEVQVAPPGQSDGPRHIRCLLFSAIELESMLRDQLDWINHKHNQTFAIPEDVDFLNDFLPVLRKQIKDALDKGCN